VFVSLINIFTKKPFPNLRRDHHKIHKYNDLNTAMIFTDERFRAFSWGFGGYGRLGHSATVDEQTPRLMKSLDGPRRGIKKVVAGGQFSLAISECPGTCYMWGQYTSSKEANMYPKPIMDLSGWNIRSIGCSAKGWMIAADDSVIGCAGSPCFGELVSIRNYI
jgi:alpha-tubulin suppressor-like RCC1 family protein